MITIGHKMCEEFVIQKWGNNSEKNKGFYICDFKWFFFEIVIKVIQLSTLLDRLAYCVAPCGRNNVTE